MKPSSFVSAVYGGMIALAQVQAKDSFFVSTHKPLMKTRFDPISFRGKISAHVHTLLGPSKLNPSLTYEEARSSRCTTAEITDDMSAYWTPAIYHYDTDQKFTSLDTSGTAVYWYGITGEGETLSEMPPGLRFTARAATRNHTDEILKKYIYFNCIGGSANHFETIPQDCPRLRTVVEFQSCVCDFSFKPFSLEWDCKTVATEDGKSTHVAYPIDNKCPAEFPCRIPKLRLETSYTFRNNAIPPGGGNFVMSTGDSTGYGLHGDFFNGFPVADGSGTDSLLVRALKNCPDMQGEARNCDVFHFQDPTFCHPEMGIVDEPVGEDYPIDKLPGNNPVWSAEDGKVTDPNYIETGTLISATPLVPPGWSMVGCLSHPEVLPYQDDDIGLERDDSHMTPAECLADCAASGYSFAGIECGCTFCSLSPNHAYSRIYADGLECTCSHSPPFLGSTNAMVAAAECKSLCTGHLEYSETYCGGDGFHMSIYAAYNQSTNGTDVSVGDDEIEALGPTVRPEPSVPVGATGNSAIPAATPAFATTPRLLNESSLTEYPLPTRTLPQPLGAAPPVSDSALPTPYPTGGLGLKNVDDSFALIRSPDAIPDVTVTVTVTTTQKIHHVSSSTVVAPSMSWADGAHPLAPAAVYTDKFWTSDVLHPSAI